MYLVLNISSLFLSEDGGIGCHPLQFLRFDRYHTKHENKSPAPLALTKYTDMCAPRSSLGIFFLCFFSQVAFVQTPQRFRKDLPDDPLGNHAASQVSVLLLWVFPVKGVLYSMRMDVDALFSV